MGEPVDRARMAARVLAGLVLGLLGGAAVVLGILAYRAIVADVYVHDWGELVGWPGLPLVLGPTAMIGMALRVRPARFWKGTAALVAALLAGGTAGAVLGRTLGSQPADPWAWSYIGAGGATLLLAAVLALARIASSSGLRSRKRGRGRAGEAFTLALLAAATAGCDADAEDVPASSYLGTPIDSAQVAGVVFLLGDPGLARMDTSPVLDRMRGDVEHWSRLLGAEGRVSMLVLGDIVYPAGLHDAEHPDRAADSLRIADQIAVVEGPAADSTGARVVFIPGNHDWGEERDFEGAVRLIRLQEFVDGWSGPAAGRVAVRPEPGTGGPAVLDVGSRLRLIVLDTAWWLLGSDPAAKDAVIDSVREALASAGERRVVMAAHHPLESAGPHGAGAWLGSMLGVRTLLKKGGILLQDLSSRPYADLKSRLLRVFVETGHPDVFAGGHEHSLQVFSPEGGGATRGLVVGSGSKLTGVAEAPGMLFGRSEPGYGKIFVLRDGSLHVELEAAPERFLSCEGDARTACMQDGTAAFRTVWSEEVPTKRAASSGDDTDEDDDDEDDEDDEGDEGEGG